MTGTTLDLTDSIQPDLLGTNIANKWLEWDTGREQKKKDYADVRAYLFATDTRTTSNSKLPWNNKTTIPKLTQIRDNLIANYMATLFPRKKSFVWEGERKDDETRSKREAIESYMQWVTAQPRFKATVQTLLLDYIDTGNCFAGADWVDERNELEDKTQVGYVGPIARRFNPLSLVMNPTAPSFRQSPKIIRSLVSLGEVKKMLEQQGATEEQKAEAQILFDYLKSFRERSHEFSGNVKNLDEYYDKDGFTSYRHYLESDQVELLTFMGDLFDHQSGEFLQNHIIIVADRHKVISNKPNPSSFGYPPIWHSGWRVRQDNLWAMGPLDNLVGIQYRIDHLENLKSDLLDLTAFPPLKITGFVEEFEWGPFERIHVGDEGDVVPLRPDASALQVNFEIDQLAEKMEQMAGAPREALGFRTPGEKTAFEVQRLENASARIFQAKVSQFEQDILEPLLNAMLELARRNVSNVTIRILDTDLRIAKFMELTKEDITGSGRLRPVAAQNFAEKATLVQNLTSFYNSSAGADQDILQHFSSEKQAKMWEELLEISPWEIVNPYIRITERGEAARLAQVTEEQVIMEGQTPAGIAPEDFDDVLPEEPVEEDVA